jgi:hypothetical protein
MSLSKKYLFGGDVPRWYIRVQQQINQGVSQREAEQYVENNPLPNDNEMVGIPSPEPFEYDYKTIGREGIRK